MIIVCGVGSPGHGWDIVDGLSTTAKQFMSVSMKNVELPGDNGCDDHMAMHTTKDK